MQQPPALHAREKSAVKTHKERLERNLFGLPASASSDPAKIVSFRDAQARARALDNGGDAMELYESATRSGDTVLAAAVVERALVRGWSPIKADYLERNNGAGAALDDLAALAHYSDNTLAATVHYVPPRADLPPMPAGFKAETSRPLNRSAAPKRARDLGDIMAERVRPNGSLR
ncbi:hypothetical protein TPB0596_31050 [Tsukamurella pulmonis]|uniref:hypothetical protein n=1 Tax=Tsukamurella pulmonis TaxID=47312 RepID=UPI001EDC9C80|nr:hypothetical protein [Tsukamurella pulmonis]BDD83342.1 hypothetical protein TPB0596_31050 [Tsukamurella pulmonis]